MSEKTVAFDLFKMIAELEDYLDFPRHSIISIFSRTPEDWVYVLKIASMTETVLRTALFLKMRPYSHVGLGMFSQRNTTRAPMEDDSTSALREHVFKIPLQGDSSALKLAAAYGLLSTNDLKFIVAVSAVRNRYAHNILNYSKSMTEIIGERKDKNQLAAALRDLRHGQEPSNPNATPIDEMEFGAFMFLAGMAGRLKPPDLSLGSGGLLGGLFSKMHEDGEIGSVPDPDDLS